ncbi:hypothetical protein [Robiginitomaculum antarcticum]|uniref:hypothetical protein n=1 Tax=Robiginitomaculum antarcticum TaxID=437507 RepID=UPI0012EA3CBF|nr:hypothetical protein [Robiginitomaculum antarcticum]
MRTSKQTSGKRIVKENISVWLRANDYFVLTKVTVMRQYVQGSDETFMGELTDCQLITYYDEKRSGLRWSVLTEMGHRDEVLRIASVMSA